MNIADSLYKLWQSTGIANFVQPVDPSITNGFEQFLHQFRLTDYDCNLFIPFMAWY